MANHAEINVGDTNWVVRISGEDVRVKVLEKTKKASGRGWEFRVKRFMDGRTVGRSLTRGSGAFRVPGQPPRRTGFSIGGGEGLSRVPGSGPVVSKKKTRTAAPATKPRARSRTRARVNNPPPASAFFSEVREPGSPSSGSSPAGQLGSLRGRGRAKVRAPAPARPAHKSPASARREIERLIKHAEFTPLVENLVKRLIRCNGTEHDTGRIYGIVMSEHRLGMPFRFRQQP